MIKRINHCVDSEAFLFGQSVENIKIVSKKGALIVHLFSSDNLPEVCVTYMT